MLLPASGRAGQSQDEQALKAFAALHPIDAHVHVFKSDAAFQAMLQRLNLKLLNILVMDDTLSYRRQLQPQIDDALVLVRSSSDQIALCTTFDPYKFDSPSFTADSTTQINQDFAHGAVALKIWKNIGMELKDRSGKYIMADDPNFQPIYQNIAAHGKTLLTHQAEPDVAWGPPDPSDPSWSYYQENPQWYVGDKPGFPSKLSILAARDRVLEKNPKLRVRGSPPRQYGEKSRQHSATFGQVPKFRGRHGGEDGAPDADAAGTSAHVPDQVPGQSSLWH